MTDMNDRVALITGASSGIGWATGEAFAARGAKVVLAARREHELATLTSEIESRGGQASFVVTDVAIAKDVERMVAHAIETFGRLDYAVNNVGIEGKFAGITDLPEQEWDRVLDTNLKGTFLCLQYEARAMLAGGHGGAIVNVGSVNSFLGFHRLGVRRLETRANRADYERFRGAGATGDPGQPRVSRIHRYADAPSGPRHRRRRLVRQGSHPTCSYEARRPPG